MSKDKEVLLLIDSHALIHRAYHAFPDTLVTTDGMLVNAVYGFAKLLLDVLDKFEPRYVIAAMDMPGKTVRHQDYGDYKANRSKTDDALVQQFPEVEELVAAFGIPILKMEGFEADDIIGTLDKQFSGENHHTIIVTGDRDLFQLVDEDTSVYLAGTSFSKSQLFDAAAVKEKMGVGPEYIVDVKSLEGDPSDNIPGVAGIGKKGAVDLITEFGHLDEIYTHIDDVPNRYQKKLVANHEMAQLSKKLATIIKDVPMSFEFDEAEFGTFDAMELVDHFHRLEFNSLIRRIDKFAKQNSLVEQTNGQLSLLGANDDVPKAEVKAAEWQGKLTDERELFVLPEINKTGDPLGWQLEELYLVYQSEVVLVAKDNLEEFMQQAQGRLLVTLDAKPFLHAALNAGYAIDFEIYDMGLSTYLTSYGRVKQELESVLQYYKIVPQESLITNLGLLQQAYVKQIEELDDNQLEQLIHIENALLPVVAQMERVGVTVDAEKLAKFSEEVSKKLANIEQEIFEYVGHEFNVASPKQVGEVLFEEKGLPVMKKTKSGAYSTDERILKELIKTDPSVELILQYREYAKILSTYIKPLPDYVNNTTNRVHATFNQIGAITGRFSSSDPNMQNIPVGKAAGVNIRSAFVAPTGKVFVALDYSQQELRLLAELSEEENMLEAFQSGKDIHAVAASEIFDIPLADVDKPKRRIGKTVNFGVVYGISAFGLADRLKIGQKEAASYIKKYFDRYPKVKGYYDELIKDAKEKGFVQTIMGRKRHTTELNSRNYRLRAAVEREIMNYPLQGSAADIIKVAMIEVQEVITDFPGKMILQVHDELIFEYDYAGDINEIGNDKQFREFVQLVRAEMLGVVNMKTPLDIGVEVGLDWGNLEPIELTQN